MISTSSSSAPRYSPDIAIPLGLIVNEFITNSFKYAFPDGTGKVELRFRKKDDKQSELVLADNGVGCPNDRKGERGSAFPSSRASRISSEQPQNGRARAARD